jgi:hypothetical protein
VSAPFSQPATTITFGSILEEAAIDEDTVSAVIIENALLAQRNFTNLFT